MSDDSSAKYANPVDWEPPVTDSRLNDLVTTFILAAAADPTIGYNRKVMTARFQKAMNLVDVGDLLLAMSSVVSESSDDLLLAIDKLDDLDRELEKIEKRLAFNFPALPDKKDESATVQ
jgi:hypothetical protein